MNLRMYRPRAVLALVTVLAAMLGGTLGLSVSEVRADGAQDTSTLGTWVVSRFTVSISHFAVSTSGTQDIPILGTGTFRLSLGEVGTDGTQNTPTLSTWTDKRVLSIRGTRVWRSMFHSDEPAESSWIPGASVAAGIAAGKGFNKSSGEQAAADLTEEDLLPALAEIVHQSYAFGQDLKTYREYLGLSQRALAKQLGVSNATISRLESGERDAPSPRLHPEFYQRLAALLRTQEARMPGSLAHCTPPIGRHNAATPTAGMTVPNGAQLKPVKSAVIRVAGGGALAVSYLEPPDTDGTGVVPRDAVQHAIDDLSQGARYHARNLSLAAAQKGGNDNT